MLQTAASLASGLFVATAFGAMVFFAAVVAPLVFTRLPEATAGGFIRQLFPWYYALLAGLSLAAAGLAATGGQALEASLCGAVGAGFVYARQGLMPRINALRDRELSGDTEAATAFQRSHRTSVVLNLAQLLVLAGVLLRMLG